MGNFTALSMMENHEMQTLVPLYNQRDTLAGDSAAIRSTPYTNYYYFMLSTINY